MPSATGSVIAPLQGDCLNEATGEDPLAAAETSDNEELRREPVRRRDQPRTLQRPAPDFVFPSLRRDVLILSRAFLDFTIVAAVIAICYMVVTRLVFLAKQLYAATSRRTS
ncbi:hypothetical protein V5799_031683 [Amblyomma americanum]|uniref:Uncharacterized protein n=1 Tax=Amblyomma americanum TaxID=6943 RepID=A0AAQ4DTB8_AMBAM